ncbi:ArnT family glycosyltransferase [Hyphococcus sp.]|jgi:4-amino-4-deoxy-L-arabinose transferase-like glycosyltransferase|uniref:ArnT family glycosyltransferase n=1 Tax=Hyphococcus sp. TaxID=2038636 RepID=UPI003D0D9076
MRGFLIDDAGLSRRAAAALVAVFAAATAFAGLFALPPLDRDEARFAQATAQMLESGDYITIRFQDAERNKKPAGIYWLQAASVAALSDVEAREIWAYRVPSMIGVVFAAVFTFLAGARVYDVRTGLLAGLLLASAPVVAAEGTIAKTDGMLLALICLAQLAFIEIYARVQAGERSGWGWPIAFWAAHGAGILVKGPIAPMISLLTGLGLTTGAPRFKWIGPMRPVIGIFVLVLMVAPWAFAIWKATDGRFFSDAIGGDMLGKVGDAQEGHVGPPGYHFALLWLLFWPAAALIVSGVVTAWKERKDWRARFFLSWLIPAWIVFEIAATKLPHYVMPLYPALAIMAAHAAATRMRFDWTQKLGTLIYAGVGLAAAALIALPPIYFSAAPVTVICFAAAAITGIAALLIAYLFWRGRGMEGGVAASLLAALYAWVLLTAVLPGLSQFAVSPRLSTLLELNDRHPLHDDLPPVALAGYSEPSAIFLLGTETMLGSGGQAAVRLVSGEASAAIIEAREEDVFQAALNGATVTSLAVIDGLNYSNGKDVKLTIYILAP